MCFAWGILRPKWGVGVEIKACLTGGSFISLPHPALPPPQGPGKSGPTPAEIIPSPSPLSNPLTRRAGGASVKKPVAVATPLSHQPRCTEDQPLVNPWRAGGGGRWQWGWVGGAERPPELLLTPSQSHPAFACVCGGWGGLHVTSHQSSHSTVPKQEQKSHQAGFFSCTPPRWATQSVRRGDTEQKQTKQGQGPSLTNTFVPP